MAEATAETKGKKKVTKKKVAKKAGRPKKKVATRGWPKGKKRGKRRGRPKRAAAKMKTGNSIALPINRNADLAYWSEFITFLNANARNEKVV